LNTQIKSPNNLAFISSDFRNNHHIIINLLHKLSLNYLLCFIPLVDRTEIILFIYLNKK